MVSLNVGQAEALAVAMNALSALDEPKRTVIAGAAGTGKTVIICEVMRKHPGAYRIAVAAFTNKAVDVLNSKQNVFRAQTLHSLLMTPVSAVNSQRLSELEARLDGCIELENAVLRGEQEMSQIEREALSERAKAIEAQIKEERESVTFRPKSRDEFRNGVPYKDKETGEEKRTRGYSALIIDEASMVGEELAEEMLDHLNCPILFFGDQHQLPPVRDECCVNLGKANYTLTQIMRQQGDSGIIPFAHHIAMHGRYPSIAECEEMPGITVTDNMDYDFVARHALDHQILCYMNKTIHALIHKARVAMRLPLRKDFPWVPVPGDELMLFKSHQEQGLRKGEVYRVVEVTDFKSSTPYAMTATLLKLNVRDAVPIKNIEINLAKLAESYPTLVSPSVIKQRMRAPGAKAEWAKVCTVHKAQGSEWSKVLYYGDMWSSHEDFRRHAYTAVTRARDEVVICSPSFRPKRPKRSVSEVLAEIRKRNADPGGHSV